MDYFFVDFANRIWKIQTSIVSYLVISIKTTNIFDVIKLKMHNFIQSIQRGIADFQIHPSNLQKKYLLLKINTITKFLQLKYTGVVFDN